MLSSRATRADAPPSPSVDTSGGSLAIPGRAIIGLVVVVALGTAGCGRVAPGHAPTARLVRTTVAAAPTSVTAAVVTSGPAARRASVRRRAREPMSAAGTPVPGARSSATTAAASLPADGTSAGAARTAAVTAGAPAGPVRTATSAAGAPAVPRGVSLWLPYWNLAAAYQSAVANAGVVGTASPFWYAISGDSTIEDDPGAGDAAIVAGLREHGIAVVPTVTETDGLRAFDQMLASAPRRAAMVRALVAIAGGGGYTGLDLDFEDFALDPGHDVALADEAASLYPVLVGEVCAALHAIARTCTVTIMPRTTAAPLYWRTNLATWVYDYGALAAVADRVRVMAYDEHAPGGPAGAIAPYPWVQQVVGYIGATMPVDKVELALPAYGYDWSGTSATSITSRQAPELAAEYGVSPGWNAVEAENTFAYTAGGRRHIVWYEGAAAEYERARLAVAAGFAGVDLWAAGGEDPAVWPLLGALYPR